ncbi:MAG: hypothetical protein EPN85_04540 [Bacteroidetes bacterium]|nr:MAG: hypothetical protein EPN85_04540 [Bacteroidota bacterium]
MKASEDLFELIQSLSRNEKRYFKRFTALHVRGKKNKYMLLFDAVVRQEKYDEAQLKRQFCNQAFIRQFTAAKNHLYHRILSALESYHHSIHSEVKSLLHRAEILFNKGLYKQSHKAILKAKQLARAYEMHHVMVEIFRHWEMNLAVKNPDVSWMQNILREETEELSLLQSTKDYRSIYYRIVTHHYLYGTTRDKKHFGQFKKMIHNPLLLDERKAKTFEAKLRFHDARSFYFSIINDKTNQYLSVKNTIAHFKKHPEKIRQAVSKFIIYLNNVLSSCTLNRKYSEIPIYLKELESLIPLAKSSDEKTKLFFITATNRLNYYTITGQFSSAVSFLLEINKRLGEYEPSMNDVEKALLFHNIALSYFGSGDYKNCIHWLNQIRNKISLNIRPDFESSLGLFYLIVHYESGNADLLPSLIQSLYRYLKKKEQLHKFETAIIHFLRNELPKTNTQEEQIHAFQKFKNRIAPLANDPYEKSPFEFFDYISWLESKIENRPFAEVVRQKATPVL